MWEWEKYLYELIPHISYMLPILRFQVMKNTFDDRTLTFTLFSYILVLLRDADDDDNNRTGAKN